MPERAAPARTPKPRWWIAPVLLLAVVLALVALDQAQVFSLATLRPLQAALVAFQAEHALLAMLVYALGFVAMTALSLPGSAVVMMLGGALFGLGWGWLAALLAATLGATLAMLSARHLLRDRVRELARVRFATLLAALDRGIENDGGFYVFWLRLVPFFPFFIVNLLLGLTPVRLGVFFVASLLGLAPLTALYVNAGTQLARLQSPADVLSWPVALSFTLLGLFPLLARRLFVALKR